MGIPNKRKGSGVLHSLMAGMLVLIVCACGQKTSPSDANRKVESDISAAVKKADPATNPEGDRSLAAVKDDENVRLAARVKVALMKDPALKDLPIDVNAADGVVELFGTVENMAKRVAAEQVASRVPGVKSVKSHLAVVKGS